MKNVFPSLKAVFTLLKDTYTEWSADKAPRLAAALAYYTIFSLAPLLIIAIAVSRLVFQQSSAQSQLLGQIQGVVGQEGTALIETMLTSASKPASGIVATLIGLVTLLLGAMGLFGQLQEALNTIWNVPTASGQGMMHLLKNRFLSFIMVLGIGFLLLLSLVISAVVSALDAFFAGALPGWVYIAQILNFVISFGIITLLFAMIFKFLPDIKIAWRDVWLGAIVTSLLFTLGKWLIGWYLGQGSAASIYGAAGSLVILLLWIYYSAQIMLFGVEFTQVYAKRFGSLASTKPPGPITLVPKTAGLMAGDLAASSQRMSQSWGMAKPKYAYAALVGLIAGLIIDTIRTAKH